VLERGPIRTGLLASIMALACVARTECLPAKKASDAQVEAAYIYNFAKFVEWPDGKFPTPNSPIRFCVLNDFSFEADLNRVVSGRSIAGRPLEVAQLRDGSEAAQCHVLYVNAAQERQMRHSLEVLREANVLTVGETDAFIDEGGMINFFLQDEQVLFGINNKAAREAGLHLSSRLLSLAKRVT
jgi:YfiR/HmsC-like